MFNKFLSSKFALVGVAIIAVLALGVAPTFAADPTSAELVTAAQGVLTSAGVMVIVFTTAIVSLGAMLYRKFRGASR